MAEIEPQNGLVIKNDTILKPSIYILPDGLKIEADEVTLDGNGAHIIGNNHLGTGVAISKNDGVTIKNLRLSNFYHGIYAQDCSNLSVINCMITRTSEIPANTEFLDIWQTPEHAPGGGMMLYRVHHSQFKGNDLQHQQNGMLAYNCNNLWVEANLASYCSGWGFHLYETCDSSYLHNWADFCCRFEPRPEGGWNQGHMGADAAGFLIVHKSCRNVFRKNLARMGGDGFFLAGLTPQFEVVGCDDNLFEENDGSYSPNIAFESTFSKGNIYRNNRANRCNYGFWLGFSRQVTLEQNIIYSNNQAGVACENGSNISLRENSFSNNHHGLLIWSKRIHEFERAVPDNWTSHDWLVEGNTFTNNFKAIRIAADQDHGIRPLPDSGELGSPAPPPFNHTIRHNLFSKNINQIDLVNAKHTIQDSNEFE